MRLSARARGSAAWLCGAVALTGVVDRIDGWRVVLEWRGAERVVSRGALPADLREGDVVKGGRIDAAATRRRREKTRALLERLRARAPVHPRSRR